MSRKSDALVEPSIFSSSQNCRLSKRFRPSVQCHHIDKQTHQQCTADGFMECVHCDEICCLNHITQHQDELKQYRDNLVQEANEVYLTLNEMQVEDTREELRSNLVLWKKRMLNKIERIYEKLLVDVEKSFEQITNDLELKKKDLGQIFDETISTKLERLSNKFDFYPHELDELRLSLNDIYHRIHDARTSLINIDYGNGNTYLLENDNSFESPKIIIQTKVDIEKILNGTSLRQFHIDIEHHSSLIYDTSNKHLLICNNENNTLQLFDQEQRIGGAFWPEKSSSITSIKWSSYLNRFLILCSQSLFALNCSDEPFNMYSIPQIESKEGYPMKYLSVNNDLMLIKYGNGILIENYSLKTMDLIQHWQKEDFYPNVDQMNINIHRIEFYSNYYLAMNVEINDENDVLDFFIFSNIQHIRRIEKSYLILYLPLNQSWIIKQQNNDIHLSILEQNGDIHQMNIEECSQIYGMKLFSKDFLLVIKQNQTSIDMHLYPKI